MSDSQLEQGMLAELLKKLMSQGHRTFKGEYGSPDQGIETGLDEAFLVDKETRDAMLEADPRSAEVLKPYLRHGDVTRWRAPEVDTWLIHMPTGSASIEDYPAVMEHLAPYREQLEKRDTAQKWYELVRCHTEKADSAGKGKMVYVNAADRPTFTHEHSGAYSSGVGWLPFQDFFLLGSLNSKLYWLMLQKIVKEAGAEELLPEHFESLPFPIPMLDQRGNIGQLSEFCQNTAEERVDLYRHVSQEMANHLTKNGTIEELSEKLRNWHFLTVNSLNEEVQRHFGEPISEDMLPAWEHLLSEAKSQLSIIDYELERAEQRIDENIYQIFGLTEEEIEFLNSLRVL